MAGTASGQPLQPRPPGAPAAFDVRDVIEGAALLASTANVIMQLARPAVGYGVVESKVEAGQVMRHPLRRLRTTITYLSVAFLGTAEERTFYRRQVNRSHAQVRSAEGSPVRYNAFDPQLQLWVAACLYRGMIDVYTLLHGPAGEAVADALYRECRRIGTTLQVPEQMWPADRTAFERYWDAALAEVRIDPPVRDYLDRLMALDYLPRPVSTAFGPVNRFLTAGFLPPPFRAQMRMNWTERDQQVFAVLIGLVAVVNRLLPGPVSRFPFNACLQDLRIRRLARTALAGPPSRPAFPAVLRLAGRCAVSPRLSGRAARTFGHRVNRCGRERAHTRSAAGKPGSIPVRQAGGGEDVENLRSTIDRRK